LTPRPDRLWDSSVSQPIGTGSFFPWGKSAGAWSWSLICI